MNNRQIDKKTMQIRIDSGLHYRLKLEATKTKQSMKKYIESVLSEYLVLDYYDEKK